MGACDISLELKGKASRSEIEAAFRRQQEYDRLENGHQSGYSGDFQTVSKVDCHLGQFFSSRNEAFEYCLKHASKWDTVVAVYFLDLQVKTGRVDKAAESLKTLRQDLRNLESTDLDRSKPFKTCPDCKSRLAVQRFNGPDCPVCQSDLRPAAFRRRLEALKAKVKAAESRLADLIKTERDRLDKTVSKAKPSQFRTLIAGRGAC
jgi:Zn finger protein HypA/HybF involved in hydrogenase expression